MQERSLPLIFHSDDNGPARRPLPALQVEMHEVRLLFDRGRGPTVRPPRGSIELLGRETAAKKGQRRAGKPRSEESAEHTGDSRDLVGRDFTHKVLRSWEQRPHFA